MWLVLAGRGFGKTRIGAETASKQAREFPGSRLGFIAATFTDFRDTMMEGESGLLSCVPPSAMRGGAIDTAWNRSLGEFHFANGSQIKGYSAERPRRLRGPQHHFLWCDETAAWQYDAETWDLAMLGLRLGHAPHAIVTTTPKARPLIERLAAAAYTVTTNGSTFDNIANLPPEFARQILEAYEGTHLYEQEIMGRLLKQAEGALWTIDLIERNRIGHAPSDLVRVVVGVDPAVTSHRDSDETGIVVVSKDREQHGYTLADLSGRYSPRGWAERAAFAYDTFKAHCIAVEDNQGGEMVEETIRTVAPHARVVRVHAGTSKKLRAQPIAAATEQGRLHMVGRFETLEGQLTTWVPDEKLPSPDRMDAYVHACTELGFTWGGAADRFMSKIAPDCPKCAKPVSRQATSCPYCGAALTTRTADVRAPLDVEAALESIEIERAGIHSPNGRTAV